MNEPQPSPATAPPPRPRPLAQRSPPPRVKVGGRDGEAFHAAPEFDDVARVAERSGVPTLAVWSAAMAAWGGGCVG